MSTIRDMRAEDVSGVLEVEQECFTLPWSRKAFEAELDDNDLAHYLVMEDEGRIIGYAGVWIVLDEAHVTNIAISQSYRRRGLGERLLIELIRSAKQYGALSMTLEVRVTNSAAQKLYEKLGFVKRGIRRQYYSDTKEDALIMWLDFL
ncbi:ribosomal-protein-alanine acetyltransferase [Sporomusaceae bacterium FL31]|nr:ribosomal-protein-alanine acetyltransferase [Sporomusaceae bacterium FL31]GCE35409.1 ribosomal-protein-alanine acetyltransferase [Sporomusaceae bacterium]